MRLEIGYKFMIGFIIVIASVILTPYVIDYLNLDLAEWLREPFPILVALTIGLITGSVISRGLTKGFRRLVELANHIGAGDLTKEVELDRGRFFQDETNDLARSLEQMLENLKGLVDHIKMTSSSINDTSHHMAPLFSKTQKTFEKVSESMKSIDRGAKKQGSHVERVRTIIKDIDKISNAVAKYAVDAAKLTAESNQAVNDASVRANTAIEKFEKVFYQMERAKDAIQELGNRVDSIPKILDFMNHISRQTDLLALNASVEASKAGEYGEGFASVAEEVRRFADSTGRSSQEMSQIIEDFRKNTQEVLTVFMEGASFVREGRQEIRRIQKSLADILKGFVQVDKRVREILALSQKQKDGVDMTVSAVQEVSHIAGENLGFADQVEKLIGQYRMGIEEFAASFDNLHEMAQELELFVMKFRTEGDSLNVSDDLEDYSHMPAPSDNRLEGIRLK